MQSVDTGTLKPLPGIEPGEYLVRWSADAKFVFVVHTGDNELILYRVALDSNRRELLQKVRPAVQVGLADMRNGYFGFDVDAAGKAIALSYETSVGALYVAQGIK
jgi:hypothetical protein